MITKQHGYRNPATKSAGVRQRRKIYCERCGRYVKTVMIGPTVPIRAWCGSCYEILNPGTNARMNQPGRNPERS